MAVISSTPSFSKSLLRSNPLISSPITKFKCFRNYPATRYVGMSDADSGRISKWVLRNNNQRAVETSAPSPPSLLSTDSAPASLDSASAVVRKFYQGINAHDLASVENLIAENCIYEDLIFPQPFVGRKVTFSCPHKLQFFLWFINL